MDYILEVCDKHLGLDRVYALLAPVHTNSTLLQKAAQYNELDFSAGCVLTRDNFLRQALSLFSITWFFGLVMYFVFATLSYLYIFDHRTFEHPKWLKHQIRLEITQAMTSLPVMAICTMPWFLAEVRGYSKMYANIDDYGWFYFVAQFPIFLLFTDSLIYLIHRGLHSKYLYKRLHKPHHKWIMPSPFASHAFHPIDGYAQSLPYHVFPFLLPLNKFAYIALFSFINLWTVLIHDGEYLANDPVINGAACHSLHHLKFSCNYGQFTTLFDRLGGSYVPPNPELFDKALNKASWERQAKEVDEIRQMIGEIDAKKPEGKQEHEAHLIEKVSVFQEGATGNSLESHKHGLQARKHQSCAYQRS